MTEQDPIAYRVQIIEQSIRDLRSEHEKVLNKLEQYESTRVSDLKLQNLRLEFSDMSRRLAEVEKEQADTKTQIVQRDLEAERKQNKQKERFSQWQIALLVGILTFIIYGFGQVLFSYITHLIAP